jgi:DNA replication protein DnaC
VISQRYDNNSAIILTSNKAFSDWAEVFAGDAIMASAALDRLLHRCTVINIRGESFRLKEKRQAARSTMAQLVSSELSNNTTTNETIP